MRIFAKTIEEFFDNSKQHKILLKQLDEIIHTTVPNLDRKLVEGPTITVLGYGFGLFKLKNYENLPIISIAPQKHVVSVYVMSYKDQKSVVQEFENKLGKVSCGVGCVRIKKIEDLNIEEFKKMIISAVDWNN